MQAHTAHTPANQACCANWNGALVLVYIVIRIKKQINKGLSIVGLSACMPCVPDTKQAHKACRPANPACCANSNGAYQLSSSWSPSFKQVSRFFFPLAPEDFFPFFPSLFFPFFPRFFSPLAPEDFFSRASSNGAYQRSSFWSPSFIQAAPSLCFFLFFRANSKGALQCLSSWSVLNSNRWYFFSPLPSQFRRLEGALIEH